MVKGKYWLSLSSTKVHLITCLSWQTGSDALPDDQTGRAVQQRQLMVMIDLNQSHTCEPKSWPCLYFTTPCPTCDISASSLPVLAVPPSASRTIGHWGSQEAFCFLTWLRKKSKGLKLNRKKNITDTKRRFWHFDQKDISTFCRCIVCFFNWIMYFSKDDNPQQWFLWNTCKWGAGK